MHSFDSLELVVMVTLPLGKSLKREDIMRVAFFLVFQFIKSANPILVSSNNKKLFYDPS